MSDKYAAIATERGRYPVRLMRAALGVSVSGFYDAAARQTRTCASLYALVHALSGAQSSARKSSTESCACLRMWASVERLIGRCVGTMILSVFWPACFCSRM